MSTVLDTILTKLQVQDNASSVFQKLATSSEKFGSKLGGITSTLTALTGIGAAVGGALSLAGAVESTKHYLENLKEVHELTGATAEQADYLFSSARKTGVEYESMKNIMFSLSRRGAMLEQSMALAGQKVPGLSKRYARLGIDISKGPVAAIESMSKAVKAGKVDAGDLMNQLRIPKESVNDFKKFLESVDMKGMKKAGFLVSDKDLQLFDDMQDAQHRISDGFNRIRLAIGVKLMPVIAKLVDKFEALMPDLVSGAQKFGDLLADHLEGAIHLALKLTKIMAANEALKFLTGKGMGDRISTGLSMISDAFKTGGIAAGTAAITGSMIAMAALTAVAVLAYGAFKAFEANLNGTRDKVLYFWDSIKARFEVMGDALDPIIDKITSAFGADGPIDLAGKMLVGLANAFDFLAHVMMVTEAITIDLWTGIYNLGVKIQGWENALIQGIEHVFSSVKNWIVEVATSIENAIRPVTNVLSKLAEVVMKYTGMGLISSAATKFGEWAGNKLDKGSKEYSPVSFGDKLGQTVRDYLSSKWDSTQQLTDKKMASNRAAAVEKAAKKQKRGEDQSDKKSVNNYDFRGSRFDITQKFAEGFDPDRIAVAMADDLAQMGEMRAQSSMSPMFAGR